MTSTTEVKVSDQPTKTVPAKSCRLSIECPQEDEEGFHHAVPIQGIKLTPVGSIKVFPSHIQRARRRCLTAMPCNLVRDSLLPTHLTKMVSPYNADANNGRVTPTKEMVLELLSAAPVSVLQKPIESQSRFSKFNKLPSIIGNTAQTKNSSNQEPEFANLETNVKPAKRRVRSTYGVQLEGVRLAFEPDLSASGTAKSRSLDEYQTNSQKEGVKLAPLVRALKP